LFFRAKYFACALTMRYYARCQLRAAAIIVEIFNHRNLEELAPAGDILPLKAAKLIWEIEL